MEENEHNASERLVSREQLEAEGVIKQPSPPRAVMKLENGFLLTFIVIVLFIFSSQYIRSARKTQQATAAYSEGMRLLKDKRWEQAITSFDKAIDNDPRFALAFARRGDANFRARHLQEALQDYNSAISLNPGLGAPYYGRAFVYMEMQKPQQAISDFDRSLQFNSRDEWTYLYRGVCYRYLGQYEQAIRDLTSAIRIKPQSAAAYAERGVTYLKQGQDSKAQIDFDKARDLSSADMKMRDQVDAAIARAEQEKYERTH